MVPCCKHLLECRVSPCCPVTICSFTLFLQCFVLWVLPIFLPSLTPSLPLRDFAFSPFLTPCSVVIWHHRHDAIRPFISSFESPTGLLFPWRRALYQKIMVEVINSLIHFPCSDFLFQGPDLSVPCIRTRTVRALAS